MSAPASSRVDEFASVLRRCSPVGEAAGAPPRIRVASANGVRTLVGWNGGVGLAHRVEGDDTPLPAEFATADPHDAPDLPAACRAQSVGPAFVRAMRDAAGVVRRTADYRYAYHRVLLDAPLGRVAATDGVALFAHGGLPVCGPAVMLPAVAAWASPVWRTADAVTVAVTPAHVVVTAGAWTMALPVDRAGRAPDYDALLARLRRPVARLDLSAPDAAAWADALGRGRPSRRAVVTATVAWAARPTLMLADAAPCVAAASSAVGPPVRVACGADRLRQALALGFRTLTTVGPGHPLVALDGPRRFVWVAHDPPDSP